MADSLLRNEILDWDGWHTLLWPESDAIDDVVKHKSKLLQRAQVAEVNDHGVLFRLYCRAAMRWEAWLLAKEPGALRGPTFQSFFQLAEDSQDWLAFLEYAKDLLSSGRLREEEIAFLGEQESKLRARAAAERRKLSRVAEEYEASIKYQREELGRQVLEQITAFSEELASQRIYYLAGRLSGLIGDTEQEILHYLCATGCEPISNARQFFLLFESVTRAGRVALAEELLRRSETWFSGSVAYSIAALQVAWLKWQLGDLESAPLNIARQSFNRIRDELSSEEDMTDLARSFFDYSASLYAECLYADGQANEALKLLRRVEPKANNPRAIELLRASLLIRDERLSEASDVLESLEAEINDVDNAWRARLHAAWGELYLTAGKAERARNFYMKALTVFEEVAPPHVLNNLAVSHALCGEFEKARRSLENGKFAYPEENVFNENLRKLESTSRQLTIIKSSFSVNDFRTRMIPRDSPDDSYRVAP